MGEKSLLINVLESSFKKPILGIILSSFFGGLGLFLINKQAPAMAKPQEKIFIPASHMIGKIFLIFSSIILTFTVLGYIAYIFKKKKRGDFFEKRKTLEDLKSLSWKEFEEFIGLMFEKLGYRVKVTGGLKDGGIDLIITKDGKTSFVQCKRFRTSKVTLSMVRDFYGTMNANLNYEKGYFITTGIFTLDAQQFAKDKPIELIDGARLMEYINLSLLNTKTQEMKPVKPLPSIEIPTCPKCGSKMVKRIAKKGAMAGLEFWGCSAYPKCTATTRITSSDFKF